MDVVDLGKQWRVQKLPYWQQIQQTNFKYLWAVELVTCESQCNILYLKY